MIWKSVFRRSWLPLGLIMLYCLLCYLQIFGLTFRATKEEGKRNYYVSKYFWVKVRLNNL